MIKHITVLIPIISKTPLLWRGVGVRLFFPFCFLLLALTLTACSFNSGLQGKGQVYLQGDWQQDSVSLQKQLINYSLYNFKFSCDSFYMKISSFSKVNTGTDTCMNSGRWTEYIRGTYKQSNDTLHLKGIFCNADFSIKKESGCFRSGLYEEYFKVGKKTDSLIQFSSTSNVIPVNLRLTKRITCHQKLL
jgi:hypothetical protein